MIVEVDGARFDVPDDASPDEIDALTKPAAPAPKRPTLLSRIAKGAGEIGASAAAGAESLGQILDPAVAAVGALGSYVVPHTAPEGASLKERFTNEMEGLRRTREERSRASPNAFGAGAILEGGGVAPALLKAAPFSSAAPTGPGPAALLQRMAAGTADAAAFNAASAAASNIDKDPVGAAVEAGTSPMNLLGAAPALIGPMAEVAQAAKPGAVRLLTRPAPKAKPTEAAKLLRKEGVPLTLGQNDPDSFYAAFEQASADSPLGMHIEQGAAKDALRDVAIRRATAPGQESPSAVRTQEQLRQLREGFNAAYEPIKAHPVSADTLAGLPGEALKPMEGVRDTTRAKAAQEIGDALTALPGYKVPASGGHHHGKAAPAEPVLADAYGRPLPPEPKPPAALPDMTAGDLINARGYIRDSIRSAGSGAQPDMDRVAALEHAEDVITAALERSLPPEAAAKLRDTDRQYSRFMTVESAAPAGHEDWTPLQWAKSIEHSSGRARFKEGRAGEDQHLAQAAQETFDQRVKPTGMRGPILAVIPKPFAGAGARLLNQPNIKAALLGETLAPPILPPSTVPLTEGQARAMALAQAMRRYGPSLQLGATGVEPIPTMAGDDRR